MKGRFFIPVLMILFACSDSKVDTTKVQAEMKAREVMVVPEGKIVERTFQLGDSLLNSLQQPETLDQSGSIFKSWELTNTIKVDCSLYLTSDQYDLKGKEKQVFEAYQYSATNQLSADPNVQKLSNATMLYSAPFEQNGVIKGMWSIKLPRKYVILSINQ